MPPSEKQISPEEKLLKVIQGGDPAKSAQPSGEEKLLKAVQPSGKVESAPASKKIDAAPRAPVAEPKAKEPSPAAKPDAAARTKPAPKIEQAAAKGGAEKIAEDAGKTGAKSRLKVAKSEEPAKEATVAAAEPPKTEEKHKTVAAGPVKKTTGHKFSVRAVNSWLAATVLVSICLSAYEMWAGVQTGNDPPQFAPHAATSPAGNEAVKSSNVDLTKLLDSFNNKDMFNYKTVVVSATVTNSVPTADWIIYAKENLKLKAFMGSGPNREAIVIDKGNQGRMSFLRIRQKFTVGSQDVTVTEMQNDQVIIGDGIREQAIK